MRTDYRPDATIRRWFNTVDQNKAPVAPVGGALRVYVDDDLAQITTGVGLTVSYDGVVGLNKATVTIATAAIPPGSTCALVFTGTVDGISVVAVLEEFTVLAQGAEIVARGTVSAIANGGGTISSVGQAKAGDWIRMTSGTSKGYKQIDSLNVGSGAFTFRAGSVWSTNPANGDAYEIISAPQLELLGNQDIADGLLTAAKLASDTITADKIAAGAISNAKLADGAISSGKLAAGAISSSAFAAGAIQPGVLAAGAIAATTLNADVGTVLATEADTTAILAAIASLDPTTDLSGLIIEPGITWLDLQKVILSFVGGRTNGADPAGGVMNFRDYANTKNVIVATLDEDGNRAAVALAP